MDWLVLLPCACASSQQTFQAFTLQFSRSDPPMDQMPPREAKRNRIGYRIVWIVKDQGRGSNKKEIKP